MQWVWEGNDWMQDKQMMCIAVVGKIFPWSVCIFPPFEEKRKKGLHS
jgi:hypothetical protein